MLLFKSHVSHGVSIQHMYACFCLRAMFPMCFNSSYVCMLLFKSHVSHGVSIQHMYACFCLYQIWLLDVFSSEFSYPFVHTVELVFNVWSYKRNLL